MAEIKKIQAYTKITHHENKSLKQVFPWLIRGRISVKIAEMMRCCYDILVQFR